MIKSGQLVLSRVVFHWGLVPILLVSVFTTSTPANMMLTISEVADDLLFELQGSIDTSVFLRGPTQTMAGISRYSHQTMGPLSITSFGSGSVVGDYFDFAGGESTFNFLGIQPSSGVIELSGDPAFWFLLTYTASSNDGVSLPQGYVSGAEISLSYLEPDTNLSMLNLRPGDFWGVSFVDGTGGPQSLTFRAVPEPSSFATLVMAICLSFAVNRGRGGSAENMAHE